MSGKHGQEEERRSQLLLTGVQRPDVHQALAIVVGKHHRNHNVCESRAREQAGNACEEKPAMLASG